jgi:murein DD-endopeptidase MepM/ murein hydrolase activator NlpD
VIDWRSRLLHPTGLGLSVLLSLVPVSALAYVPQNSNGQAHLCSAVSAPDKKGQVVCRQPRTTFTSGDDVCLLVRFKDARAHQRYRAIAYRNGKEQRRFTSEPGTSRGERSRDFWSHCESHIAVPGDWRFDVFVDSGRGFKRLSSAHFQVEADAPYRFVDAATCSFLGAPAADGSVACLGETDVFLPGEPVNLWVKLADVTTDYRFLSKTFRDGKQVGRRETYWRDAGKKGKHAYFAPTDYESAPGRYRAEFFIDTGKGFKLVGERSYVVAVLSPVKGDFEQRCSWSSDPSVWGFCKHRRRHSGGEARADDTRAWDVNLPRHGDGGKPVYPVAPGRVVRYGGEIAPGGGRTASVLIEHKTPGGERWWSGYLHMRRDSIKVREGQWVGADTEIGRIGRTGASNNHLHVAVYSGKNTTGGLRSMDVSFRSRDAAGSSVIAAKRRLDGSKPEVSRLLRR